MSLTKVTYSMVDAPVLNLKDYGAVGDGVADDTAAWLAFKTACSTTGSKGIVPTGNYLIDPFTFGPSDSGLILEGPTHNTASTSPGISGPGYFGAPIAVFRARSASTKFVSFSGAYSIEVSNIAFDGNQFSDSVFYFGGTVNNTALIFNTCEFYGATNAIGVVHFYDGTLGGNNCYFYDCYLYQYHNYTAGTNRAKNCILNTNTNAFIINYTDCIFAQASVLIEYNQGSCNLYGCSGYEVTTAMISIINTCQPFICSYWYNEGSPNVPFIQQQANAGVTTYYPINIVNPIINSTNSDIILTCQQPVNIYGGFIGGDIQVNPVATYGTMNHIFDSVAFNTSYGIIGTGSITQTITRNCSVNYIVAPTKDYGALKLAKYASSIDAGATISVTNETWITVSNSGAQNVTGLTGGLVGQQVILYFDDGNTTLVNSGTLKLQGSTNVTPTNNSVITFIGSGAAPGLSPAYYSEVSRSIK